MKKRLRILLIKPFNISDHIQPSLGLGYLATVARKRHQVHILDCIKERIWGKRLLSYIRGLSPDIVGFQLYTYDLTRVRSEISLIKETFPHIITIAGGPHPSAIPAETLVYMKDCLDFVFCGECEISFPLFLDILAENPDRGQHQHPEHLFKAVAGLCGRTLGGGVFVNPPMLVENLDSLGFPAWDLIRPQTYPEAQHGAFFKHFPIAPVMTGRGCPFRCTFCEGHIITGRKVRKRSVPDVIEEIKMLKKNYGIREIHIVDDNFSLYKDYVMEFCETLLKEKIGMSWATPNGVRIDTLDKEMLWAMKRSGYYLASVGIEFGSERMFKVTQKHLNMEKVRRGVALVRSVGLQVAGFFMMGYPGETEEEINQTIAFSLSLPLIRANFFIFLPLPGTEAYKELEKNTELKKVDWEHFYFTHPVYIYKGFSVAKLRNLQRKAFVKFYIRPHIFLLNILQIKTTRQFLFLLKRFYRWVIAM